MRSTAGGICSGCGFGCVRYSTYWEKNRKEKKKRGKGKKKSEVSGVRVGWEEGRGRGRACMLKGVCGTAHGRNVTGVSCIVD